MTVRGFTDTFHSYTACSKVEKSTSTKFQANAQPKTLDFLILKIHSQASNKLAYFDHSLTSLYFAIFERFSCSLSPRQARFMAISLTRSLHWRLERCSAVTPSHLGNTPKTFGPNPECPPRCFLISTAS